MANGALLRIGRLVATSPPTDEGSDCRWCDSDLHTDEPYAWQTVERDPARHAPDCLWIEARAECGIVPAPDDAEVRAWSALPSLVG